jgi:hypothetical protein
MFDSVSLIRHAETGTNGRLSPAGRARSHGLVQYFYRVGYPQVICAVRRDEATDACRQTAAPLARALHLQVVEFRQSEVGQLVEFLHSDACFEKQVLVVWLADGIPDVARALGVTAASWGAIPTRHSCDSRDVFDIVWEISRLGEGRRFASYWQFDVGKGVTDSVVSELIFVPLWKRNYYKPPRSGNAVVRLFGHLKQLARRCHAWAWCRLAHSLPLWQSLS